MLELASSEARLIEVARSIFTGSNLHFSKKGFPDKIGPTALKVCQDTLSKGVVSFLVKEGWEKRVFLQNGVSKKGRFFERHSPSLKFSSTSFEILNTLRKGGNFSDAPETFEVGDEILLSLCPNSVVWRKNSPLCWLLDLESLVKGFGEVPTQISFDSLVAKESWVVEALTSRIVKSWVALEKSKNVISDLNYLKLLGSAQNQVMIEFLKSCEKFNRKDLSVIFTETAVSVMNLKSGRYPTSLFWKEGFAKNSHPLSAKQNASKDSGVFLKNLLIIESWYKEVGIVPHWETDYQQAQTFLTVWKPMTTRPSDLKDSLNGFERAASLYKELIEI